MDIVVVMEAQLGAKTVASGILSLVPQVVYLNLTGIFLLSQMRQANSLNKFYYSPEDRNLKTKLFMQKSEVMYTYQQESTLIKSDWFERVG